jgi:hypothetical protein
MGLCRLPVDGDREDNGAGGAVREPGSGQAGNSSLSEPLVKQSEPQSVRE